MASIDVDTIARDSTQARARKPLHPSLYLLGGFAALVCAALLVDFAFRLIG